MPHKANRQVDNSTEITVSRRPGKARMHKAPIAVSAAKLSIVQSPDVLLPATIETAGFPSLEEAVMWSPTSLLINPSVRSVAFSPCESRRPKNFAFRILLTEITIGKSDQRSTQVDSLSHQEALLSDQSAMPPTCPH